MIHAAKWGQHKGSRPGVNPTGRPQRGRCSHECWAAKDFPQPSCYGDFSISLPQERTAVTGHFPAWPGLGWGTRMGAEGLSAGALDFSPCPCTSGRGFLVVPPLPGVGYLLACLLTGRGPLFLQPHPPASVSICVFCCSLGDCRLLFCKESFEGFEEAFSAACPAPPREHGAVPAEGPVGLGTHGSCPQLACSVRACRTSLEVSAQLLPSSAP